MNARQMKKNLKKQINKLQRDNDLMRKIISDSPSMQKVYDLWNKPLNIQTTTISFQEFKVERPLFRQRMMMGDGLCMMEHEKQLAMDDLLNAIEDYITFEINDRTFEVNDSTYCTVPILTASVFVGKE